MYIEKSRIYHQNYFCVMLPSSPKHYNLITVIFSFNKEAFLSLSLIIKQNCSQTPDSGGWLMNLSLAAVHTPPSNRLPSVPLSLCLSGLNGEGKRSRSFRKTFISTKSIDLTDQWFSCLVQAIKLGLPIRLSQGDGLPCNNLKGRELTVALTICTCI